MITYKMLIEYDGFSEVRDIQARNTADAFLRVAEFLKEKREVKVKSIEVMAKRESFLVLSDDLVLG